MSRHRHLFVAFLSIFIGCSAVGAADFPRDVTAIALRNWPPQYLADPNTGEPTGFGIDILNKVADMSGISVRYIVFDSWPEAFRALEERRAIVAPNLGVTPNRLDLYDFTTPYETFRISLFVRAATTHLETVDDLAGKTVGVVQKNQGLVLMRKRGGADLRIYDSMEEAFMALLSGNVEALVYPEQLIHELAHQAGLEDKIKVIGRPLQEIKRAIAVRKGEPELFQRLDAAVQRLIRTPAYERIYEKWYGTPKPFWTVRRVVFFSAALFGVAVVGMMAWRHATVLRLNRFLAEAEERFRGIVESADAGYFFIDLDGRFQRVNRAWLDMHGYERAEEVIGRPLELTRIEADGAPAQPAAAELLRGSAIPAEEFAHRCRDGTVGYHTLCGHPVVQDGRVVGFEGFIIDANERKRSERALRESEEKYRLLFDHAGDAIFIHDEETRILGVNPSGCELLGYSAAELTSLTIDQLRAGEEVRYTRGRMARLMTDGQLTFETVYRRKDGAAVPVEVGARKISWEGKPAILTVCRDITERQRAEEQARYLQKAESLTRMAGAIAHHFNNQLSVVMGNLELYLDALSKAAANRKFLTAAMQASRKAAEVSGLMLTYLGQGIGRSQPIDISEICRRHLPILQAEIPEHIALETDFPPSGPIAPGDPDQMRILLVHLLLNAVEAIGEQAGAIRLTTGVIERADLPETIHAPADWEPSEERYAFLAVSDTGCGIDPADMGKLFDPFFTTKFTGRGLGLPVVRGVVKSWGGAVGAESRVGCGSRFRLFLPLLEGAVRREASARFAAPAPEMANGGVVLLVDDQETVRKMGETMLRRLGFAVRLAESGVVALDLFRRDPAPIGCVITDLTMPGMDGWETLAALREIRPGVPVILASGYDKSWVMKSDAAERPQAFLQKPYAKADLERALRQALSGWRRAENSAPAADPVER